jgi:thiamine-phosphate pyrophosphorylase
VTPTELHSAWRIIDANFNRVGEGLRVLEEHARFAAEDRFLAAEIKSLRHELAAAMNALGDRPRLTARDTPGDVGTTIATPQEYDRPSLIAVTAANW